MSRISSMKDAGALLLAIPERDTPEEKTGGDDYSDGDAKRIAKDGARLLLDSIRDDDADGIVDAFRVLSRACPMISDEDEEDTTDGDPLERGG